MFAIRSIYRGVGPWVEIGKGMTHSGGVLVFANKPLARAYASNAGIRGEVFEYDDVLPTVEAVRDGTRGWRYI